MNALDTINNIIDTNLYNSDLKYCLVDSNKRPFKIDNTPARPNKEEDFVNLEDLLNCKKIENYAGVGISIQASKICAIDVDHCFSTPFDVMSGDERYEDIKKRFRDIAYIEFSFSGTGLRVLFKADIIENYSDKYYIKNESKSIEYYQPTKSYRYVTVTGKTIFNNIIQQKNQSNEILKNFVDSYMLKPIKNRGEVKTQKTETRTLKELITEVKKLYFKDSIFQDKWFGKAPGSGKNESEIDFYLLSYIYENVTQDKEMIKQIFETSPYFNSKDWKHVNKWNYQNFRYYNYLYDVIKRN